MSSPNLFDLKGRVAEVTGGNGGIGRSIAMGLVKPELLSRFWPGTKRRTNVSWLS